MNFGFLLTHNFLLIHGFISQITNGYQLFNFKKCNGSVSFFNLDLYSSLVINGSFNSYKTIENSCKFSFTSKDQKNQDLILFNLQIFETIPMTHSKNAAVLLFSSRGKGLFQFNLFDTDMVFRNMFITGLLMERKFIWKDKLQVDLKIYGPSVTNIVLVISPGFYCSNVLENEMFKCEDGFKENNICIANHFKCDGWNNCPYRETDESQLTCHSQFIHHILIPSLILSCTVFILGWILLKLTPCLLEQRRLFLVRRNHLVFNRLASGAVIGRNMPQILQNLPFARRSSETNLTPENIPNSPPKYQNIYQPTNTVDHHLPPSYSEEVDIGVIPDFFKRFFGKIRQTSNLENLDNNIYKNSNLQKTLFESQSDGNRHFISLKQQENYVISTGSDTLTSITSTDVFWNVQNIPHPLKSNRIKKENSID